MQKFLRTLMLAALMLVPFASQAQTLTVCDGTVNSEYVPFDGYNADAAQHNQMLYPATDLTAMNGQAIMQMVFYIDQSASNGSNTAASRLGTWTVSLGETTATTLSSLDNTTTLTQVYQGYFDCSTGTLTLEFDQAYLYNGGNLLVDLNHAAASWNRWYFLGVTTTADASYNGYDEESYTFLPKCTFTYGAAPSCFKVSNLTASNATTSSLTLTWTDALNTNATYSIYDMSDTTLLMANVTGTTCVVNSLSPATTYTLGVQTNCGSDNADGYTVVTGTTACEAITTFPWSEDFEDMTGSSSGVTLAEPCWLNEHISGSGTYFFEVYSSTSAMGGNSTKMLRLHDMSNGTQTKLRLPAMDFQGNYQFVVDVYRNASGTSYTSEGVRVFASTDGEIAGATELGFLYRNYTQTDGGVVTAESASGWYTYEFNIPITNGTGYIILRGESSYGSATYMDNFIVREAPSCLAVTGLAVSAATNNSLTLTWTDALNTGATYSIVGSDGSVIASGITATTYTVTGLTANTVYVFGVEANCSATDASSAVLVTGRTECDATTALPYAENFSGYTGLPSYPYSGPAVTPSCWDYYSNGTNTAATTSSAYYGTVATYNGTSSYGSMVSNDPYLAMPIQITGSAVTSSTYIGYETARGNTKYAVMPAFDAALNTLQISFDYKMSSTYSATGAATMLELGYITSDTSSFVSIWNHNSTTTLQHVTELNLSTLAAAAPAGARLAFKFSGVHNGTGTSSYSTVWVGIDNIVVEALPSCLRISDLAVSETSSNSISLTWSDTLNTGATYSVYTITPSDTTLVEAGISTTTYTVTGLTANTAYVFGVVANCSATDASVMTVVSARTACTTITVDDVTPYIENFDSYTVTVTSSTAPSSYPNHEQPGCWSFLNMSATSSTYPQAFMTNYSSYADSANCLFFKSSNTTPLYAILPEFDATGALQLQFSYRNEGVSAYNGTIIVGVMSNAADAATFVALDTMAQTTTITSVEKIIPASVLVNGARIAFCYLGGSSNNYYAAIDNVIVSEAPACVPVVALTADSITAHEALLTWIGEASSYNVYDMSDTTLITTVYDTVVNLTNLTADASHTIGVASVCGSEESDTMTVTFRTLVSCPVPTGLAVTLTPGDGTVADINWVEAGEATEWEICLNNDMANTIVTYDTFYNFTSLTAEQAYTVKVRAICGIDDTSAWTAVVNFTPTNAYAITVFDGTSTNGYVPVYGFYADAYLRSQTIYPATNLSAMTGGMITSLTFYANEANVSWGNANFAVKLAEVPGTTLTAFDTTPATTVYTGSLAIVNNVMTVTFPAPYHYNGGNLLVEVDNLTTGSYVTATWIGTEVNGASCQGYSYSSFDAITGTVRDFIPKTTMNYVPAGATVCMPVINVTVDSVSATSVSLSWIDTLNTGATYSIYTVSDTNTTLVASGISTTNYEVTNLTASTGYTFGVVTNCSATDSSNMAIVNARTDCAGGSCQITIYAEDSYGDGWGSDLVIAQNGATVATYSMADQGLYSTPIYDTFQVSVCSGAPVTFTWVSGGTYAYDDEASFTIVDGGNGVVYTCTDASTLTDGAVFATATDPCPSCIAPVVTVDSVDTTSVSISWTGTAASYDVYNGTTFVANVTTTNYTFTGLTAATTYTFGVQAICSATDSSALATINAMTACADVTTLPYMEGFENGLGCWTTVNGSADGYPWFTTTSNSNITAHSGNAMAVSVSYYSSAVHANAWMISPKFVLPTIAAGDTLNLAWWHKVSANYPTELYDVMLSTTTADTAAFTTTLLAVNPDSTNDWVNKVVDLSAYAGQSVYIAFHHHDSYDQNYLLIDEISLAVGAAPVPDPDTMTVTFAVNDATMGTTNPAPGTYQYLSGDTVRFEAIATTGHVFTGWNLTVGTQSFTSSGISVYFDVNTMLRYGNTVTVTANFEPGTPDSTTITYAVNDPTLGTTNPAPGTYTIYVGDSINASATAYTGSVLAAWVMDIIVDSAVYRSDTLYSDDPEFTNPWYVGRLPQNFIDAGASIVITAIFEDEDPGTTYYTVTGVANDTAMGYVLGSNRYAAGSEVVLTAVANNGYRFVRWSNGETTATITFTATENVELTAFFEVDNTGIEDANMANVSIYSTDNKIVVRGAEGQSIYVFDLNGRVMASEANAAESVEFRMQTTGVYLVKVGTAAAKRVIVMR